MNTGIPKVFAIPGEEEKQGLTDVIQRGHLSRYGAENDPKFKRKYWLLQYGI